MHRSRQFRLVAALIALFGMLFMQLAVASYACPGLQMGQAGASAAMSTDAADQNMVACQGMDEAQPSLCHAHDQVGNQSLDKAELPHVQPFMAAELTLVFDDIEPAYSPIAAQTDSVLLTRATAPPLSIRHCCFQI